MLENIKSLLGIDATDTTRDTLLMLLISLATARLKNRLGGIDPPQSLEYIIVDVVVSRFNRIGSEGLASHSVEGETMSFSDSDFDGFADDIQAFLDTQQAVTRGRLRFL